MTVLWNAFKILLASLIFSFCALIAFVGWYVAAHEIHSTKDFWDVATAIGTCGAVFTALWLAQSERSRRKEEAMDKARIVVFRVSYILDQWRTHHKVTKRLESAHDSVSRRRVYNDLAWSLGSLPGIEDSDLLALTALPNNCAEHISYVGTLITASQREIKKCLESYDVNGKFNEPRLRMLLLHQSQESIRIIDEALITIRSGRRTRITPYASD